jgi:hypothetical protein
MWGRYNVIFVKEDVFRPLGVGTVRLGEYNDFEDLIC